MWPLLASGRIVASIAGHVDVTTIPLRWPDTVDAPR
jgi:hypothetical protein